MAEDSKASRAWTFFDAAIARAAPEGVHRNPWIDGRYEPDIDTLETLLGCALAVVPDPKDTRSGVAAKALDAWLAYELRCAGFLPDAVWPRARHPRVMPPDISLLLDGLPRTESAKLRARLESSNAPRGVVSANANILGRNYLKQVDVVMSSWATGPEILISTKRMDASYGKNAANRIEEANGDAKNLRGRHPLSALGFVFGLRSDAFTKEPASAAWLVDQLQKLNREDDAYDAVALIVLDYDIATPLDNANSESEDDEESPALIEPGSDEDDVEAAPRPLANVESHLNALPRVRVRRDLAPMDLDPAAFLTTTINHVLDTAPISMHTEARRRASRPFIDTDAKRRGK